MSSPPFKNIFQKYPAIFILFIMLLGACLRFYQMDRTLGGGDENHMLLYFGYTHLKYIATTYFDASNHILHTMMVNLMGRWFGEENAMAIRFPSFLFGVAGLWMIYKVALEIFASRKIALMALLISAVNPIHIYYSQTARGYSLMIFFSTAIIYFVVKLLNSKPNLWHVIFLTLCGFLSIYTLPTNIFFMAALAGWLVTVFLAPQWCGDYNLHMADRKQKALWFAGSALIIALLSFFSYLPLFGQMVETARNHSLLTVDIQSASVLTLLSGIIGRIFEGPLKWFFPLLLVGLLYGKVRHKSYRYLPLFVFFLPLAIAAASGVGGYPRNHLFNFSLFTLFLAAGISVAGEYIGKWFESGDRRIVVTGVLAVVYSLTSLNVVFFEHYPAIKTTDGNLYKEKVLQNNGSNDLLIINDAKNYLYARSTYKTTIQNIIRDNNLSRVNFIKQTADYVKENEVSTKNDMWSLFNNIIKDRSLHFLDVSGGKEIATLSKRGALSILPEDFESSMQWKVIQGNGEISKVGDHGLNEDQALKFTALSEKSMVSKLSVPGIYKVTRTSFVVLVLAVKNFSPKLMVYHPLLTANFDVNGRDQKVKLHTRKVNDGINVRIKEESGGQARYYWKVNAFVGVLPPGSYNFEMFLKCHEGNSVLYSGLRMFLIEAV